MKKETEEKYNHSVKNIRKQFKEKGVFYTDVKLAKTLKEYMPKDITEVYDPTCGSGNLLSVFEDNVKKYGQEIDKEQATLAQERLGENSEIVADDTLTEPAFKGKKFKGIVANYPFSIAWTPPTKEEVEKDERFKHAPTLPTKSRADFAFLLHILHYLSEDGTAAVLAHPGVLYREKREKTIREWLVRENVISEVVLVRGKYFEDTNIDTAIIVFKKDKGEENTGIVFKDLERGKKKEVSFKEIEQNEFTLSPTLYLNDGERKEVVDIDKVEEQLHLSALNRVREILELELSFGMMKMGNYDSVEKLLSECEKVLSDFRVKFDEVKKSGKVI